MIDTILGPACLGASIDNVGEVETLWNRLIRMTYQYGDEGIVRTALSGIDIALWDLVAKRDGVPVAALLGPTIHERIPVYASLHWLGNAEAIARDIDRALDAGFEAIKLHESDPELIHAARAHIGPDVPLMIDASAAYDQVGAIDLAYAVADASLTWLEEPMYPQRDRGALARVRAAAPMPIAAGENEYSPRASASSCQPKRSMSSNLRSRSSAGSRQRELSANRFIAPGSSVVHTTTRWGHRG